MSGNEREKEIELVCATQAVETCRRINRSAAKQFAARGIQPIDIALASVYASHDCALAAGMDAHAAIEWIRSATDLMERQLLAVGLTG